MKEPITAIIFLLSLLFPLLAGQAGADPQTERAELLSQGASFFRQANESDDPEEARRLYSKALLRYEKLSREIENGKLYYNIGNVYFRLDDLGRAIVNYRRAEQLIPDDPNLLQNLDYALGKRQDGIEPKQEEELLRTLFFWHYDLPSSVRMKIFAGFYIAFWLLAGLTYASPLVMPKWPLVLSLLLAVSLGGSLLFDRSDRALPRGVLVAPEVIARKGDSTSYQPSFQAPLHPGTEFAILEDRDTWLHIELADGRQCWVATDSVEKINTLLFSH